MAPLQEKAAPVMAEEQDVNNTVHPVENDAVAASAAPAPEAQPGNPEEPAKAPSQPGPAPQQQPQSAQVPPAASQVPPAGAQPYAQPQPQQPYAQPVYAQPVYQPAPLTKLTGGMKFAWFVIGALVGIPGIILAWVCNVDKYPQVKSDAVKFSAIGFAVWIVLGILLCMMVGGMLAAAVAGYGSGYYDYYGTMW